MTRFNNVGEVLEYAHKVAAKDIQRHKEHGLDLNPFCTEGARNMWQRGYDNAPASPWEHDLSWDTVYQRGRAVAVLLQSAN